MKKPFYYLLLLIFAISSCQDEQDVKVPKEEITVVNGRLKFNDDDHFLETVSSLQQGNSDVIDGRLLGLNYKSYLSTLGNPKLISEDFQLLDNFEFRVLLNENKEVQVGEKIYAIGNDETKVFNMNMELIDAAKNEISYYDRKSKSFESKDLANGKSFGVDYIEFFGWELDASTQFGIRYRYIRVNAFLYVFYYYETEYHSPLYGITPTTVEYFERVISDCEISSCETQPDNPYGGVTYNVGKVRYPCGANSRQHELTNGAFLRAVYYVKAYNKTPRYVYHQEDLDIP
jgi:hypothetical protein